MGESLRCEIPCTHRGLVETVFGFRAIGGIKGLCAQPACHFRYTSQLRCDSIGRWSALFSLQPRFLPPENFPDGARRDFPFLTCSSNTKIWPIIAAKWC